MSIPDLCSASALELRRLIDSRAVSCVEIMRTYLDWIDYVNPEVNAICTLRPDLAIAGARAADARLNSGLPPRPLEGLPIAIKDLAETRGIRTTSGSPLFRDHVPEFDALHVERIRAAGAILIGKTNTPEWGAGSQTFNRLFGTTANPFDPSRTAGGSSGGAAAALASRMLPIADGSDLGGSLRNPAAFCNVVGFRPTPGRVPNHPDRMAWSPLAVHGPMARSVADAALLLSVMAGPDARAPLSLHDDPAAFARPLDAHLNGARIAWTEDLGFLPVAAEIRNAIRDTPRVLESIGCVVDQAHPELRDAPAVFQTLRAFHFAARFGGFHRDQRELLKDTIQWNTALGLSLSAEEVGRAEIAHTRIYLRALAFFDDFDFLALPATQVAPFDKHTEWVRDIEGVRFENYLQWMEICSVITLTGCPAVSVPCGFTPEGLPVGLQLVARPGADRALLELAHAFEAATGFAARAPDLRD
jgi:amidase